MNICSRLESRQMLHRITLPLAVALFLAGCASTPVVPAPNEQMALSRDAVRSATSAGGNEFAPIQLRSAMEKMDGAERAMGAKNHPLARQLAEQAQVDAKLSEAAARSAKAKQAADALQEGDRVLNQEIDRKSE